MSGLVFSLISQPEALPPINRHQYLGSKYSSLGLRNACTKSFRSVITTKVQELPITTSVFSRLLSYLVYSTLSDENNMS